MYDCPKRQFGIVLYGQSNCFQGQAGCPVFGVFFLAASSKKHIENRAAVTSLWSFLFGDNFRWDKIHRDMKLNTGIPLQTVNVGTQKKLRKAKTCVNQGYLVRGGKQDRIVNCVKPKITEIETVEIEECLYVLFFI